jgi:hypothetical protein
MLEALRGVALYGAETWVVWEIDEQFETWCWRMLEISWTDRVKNEEVLRVIREERNIPHAVNITRTADWIGQILRRNCLLKHVTEVTLEG